MNKLNNKRIIVVTVCVIAFLALFFRSDNSIAPIIAEQSSTTTSAEVDILSNSKQTQPTTNASKNLPLTNCPRFFALQAVCFG